MTVLDLAVLAIVAASVISSAAKGFLRGAISLAAVAAGLLLAARYYSKAAPLFEGFVDTPRAALFLGFTAIFLSILLIGMWISHGWRRTLKRTGLDWTDHLLGAGFGLLRGWLLCSAVYLALTAFPVKFDAVERAQLAPYLIYGARVITYVSPGDMRERFTEGYNKLQEIWGKRDGMGRGSNERQAGSSSK